MIRRVQIKADNVSRLLLEVGILAQHVTAQSVRLKAVPCPNPRNGHVIGAQRRGQPAAAPVGGFVLRATAGPFQNARLKFGYVRAYFATLMASHQSPPDGCQKTLSPALDIRGRVGAPPLEQWSDIEKADEMARRSAGLDSTESAAKGNVALNLVNQPILAMQNATD